MITSRLPVRSRRCVRTAVFYLCLLSLFLLLAACSAQSTTVAEPTVVEPTLPPPTETAVPPTPTSEPLSPLAAELDAWMQDMVERAGWKGVVLVAHGDEIILNQGYGMADVANELPNTPATKFRIAGLTMPFTALAIMQLQERGLLEVNDPICKYLDDCPAAWADVTIQHLLTCSSGIPSYIFTPDWTLREEYAAIAQTPTPPEQLLAPLLELPLIHAPGDQWGPSCDSGYALLGQIIESVSGQTYADFLQENILDPSGMTDTGTGEDPQGLSVRYATRDGATLADPVVRDNLFAHGSMYSTAGDLYRWARALNSEQLVSSATLDQMFERRFELSFIPEGNPAVGYGWILSFDNGRESRSMVGSLGDEITSWIELYPEYDVTVVRLSNQENLDLSNYSKESLEDLLFKALDNEASK
jgi:CubicO group peptidase (beta-lactamase class C family)